MRQLTNLKLLLSEDSWKFFYSALPITISGGFIIIIIIIIIIYYATKAAQENTNIQTYKTYKKETREAIRNKTTSSFLLYTVFKKRGVERLCNNFINC